MIEHPLVPTIMEIDDKLNELIKVQKELHFAFFIWNDNKGTR